MQRKQNMAESQDNSWRTQSFRQNVRGKIEEAIRQSGNPTTKSVAEMENHVFQKAKTKEEYLGFVARLIIHVREMIDDDSDTDSSSSNSDSEIETYLDDDDTVDDSDEEEIDSDEQLPCQNGAATDGGAVTQIKQGSQEMAPHGVKRKCMEGESISSVTVHQRPLEKWNTQINEYEAVGVNVFKKLQRMDPHQALFAESLITKVLRLGLLQSLTSDTDVCKRLQYGQDFAPVGSSHSNSLVNHSATPMYVNTIQSDGNCTFSNTVPLSTAYSVITSSSSALETGHGLAVTDHNLPQNNHLPETSNTVGQDQNSAQNSIFTHTPVEVIAFKSEPIID